MNELFTLILKLSLVTNALLCATSTPDALEPTIKQPFVYHCQAQIDNKTYIITGQIFEMPAELEPKEMLPGDAL